MDIQGFINNFGLDESSLTNKDRQKLINAIENDKHSVAYGVYKKVSVDPMPRKVFLDKYSLLKTTKSPQQLASEIIQETQPKSFYTAKGSYYEIVPSDNGLVTKRFKAPHTNSPGDVGWKTPSTQTVFVDPEVAQRIGMFQGSSAKNKRILVSDGKILHLSWNDAAGQLGKDFEDIYHTSPKAGLSPLELWEPEPLPNTSHIVYAGNHPGSPITQLLNETRNPEIAEAIDSNKITPQQLATEVIQGTVENKNISNTMNEYLDNKTQLPIWVNELAGVDDTSRYNIPRTIAFDELKPIELEQSQDMIFDNKKYSVVQMMGGYALTDGEGSRVAGIYQTPDDAVNAFSEFKKQTIRNKSQELVKQVVATSSPSGIDPTYEFDGNEFKIRQREGGGWGFQEVNSGKFTGGVYESPELAAGAYKEAMRKPPEVNSSEANPALIERIKTDMTSAPWLNAGIGAGSIALSQMQGNGLVGTGVNLAGALGGSMMGEQYLGKSIGSPIARIGGGLAGHTIANILMGLFRNPQEQQLLNQGMQYSQQQNGGMG